MMLDAEGGILLNGVRLERPSAVAAGDRVAAGEQEYLFIRVRE